MTASLASLWASSSGQRQHRAPSSGMVASPHGGERVESGWRSNHEGHGSTCVTSSPGCDTSAHWQAMMTTHCACSDTRTPSPSRLVSRSRCGSVATSTTGSPCSAWPLRRRAHGHRWHPDCTSRPLVVFLTAESGGGTLCQADQGWQFEPRSVATPLLAWLASNGCIPLR